MTRRTLIGLTAVLAGGLAVGAAAFAYGGYGDRHGFKKRIVSAVIDDALDAAAVTPEQRAQVHEARDRVFAAFEAQRRDHAASLEEGLALFESDQLDPARLSALHRRRDEARQQIAEAVHQAIADVHRILGPEQRRAVAGYVREQHRGHWH
jgi:Spy/CpxP family protein refolding chaperone